MIRTAGGHKESLMELAQLTGDEISFVDANVLALDGVTDVGLVDMTVSGDESDEQRFWSAWRAYGEVISGHDENGEFIGLVRRFTDEEVAARYAKQ